MSSSRANEVAWLWVAMLSLSSAQRWHYLSPADCPIGFTSARIGDDHICYRLKGPESFDEKYVGCAGNMYASQLLRRGDSAIPRERLWADYVNLYPGGPFVDWSYRETIGEFFNNTYDIKYSPEQLGENLCTVREASGNITAVLCSEKHYRLCVVKLYDDVLKRDGCGEGYFRLWSPVSSCLKRVTETGGSAVRATWKQAHGMCERSGGELLQRGWRYGNHHALDSPSDIEEATPLGIYMTRSYGLTWSTHIDGESDLVPRWEWSLPPEEKFAAGTKWVSLVTRRWKLVDESYVFYKVVCEQRVTLTAINMILTNTQERRLELNVSDAKVEEKDITCLTDSAPFQETKRVGISRVGHSSFALEPGNDGYYWCIVTNLSGYLPGESNKELYLQTKQSAVNKYAVKIHLNWKYNLTDMRGAEKSIRDNLNNYIFTYIPVNVTKMVCTEKVPGDEGCTDRQTTSYHKHLSDLVTDWKLKRTYLDRQTLLYHAKIHSSASALLRNISEDIVKESQWRLFKVQYMKPVYFCQAFDSVPMLRLGKEFTLQGKTYSCAGDFNEGVQWQERIEPKPEEQVLKNLEKMVQEDGGPINSEHLQSAISQVNSILDGKSEAKILGRIFQLIEEVSARMELNGSQQATQVRNNIGVVVAESVRGGARVRGLRLSYSGADELSENTLHVITGAVNDSYMNSNTSEGVVILPKSLVDAERRVTFVVFRNNRAFYSAAHPDEKPLNGRVLRVNSRVLGVTVSNFSNSFDDGEYIDIHMRPLDADVARDERRTCGYWHFNTDNTGYWSQEGCVFMPSSAGAGRLDVCRCTHLTHFAEILTHRTVFSEADESALEVISIIGCLLSMIGVFVIWLTAVMFRAWRRDFGNKIWLHLSTATFLLAIAFLIVVFSDFERFSPLCMLSGVVLHYATLASFCWMVVSAVLSYRRLVVVFARETSHKLLRACAFAWGVPCAFVAILLAVDPKAYSRGFTEVENTTASFCYPSGLALFLTVYAPVAVALLANWTLFALIIRSAFYSRSIDRQDDANEAVRCATISFILVFLFGLPWVFGLFSAFLAFAYLFALTATYQGLVLFLFFVAGKKKTRDMWFNVLKNKQTRKVPATSSTYNSNGWRSVRSGGGGGATGALFSSGLGAMEDSTARLIL